MVGVSDEIVRTRHALYWVSILPRSFYENDMRVKVASQIVIERDSTVPAETILMS